MYFAISLRYIKSCTTIRWEFFKFASGLLLQYRLRKRDINTHRSTTNYTFSLDDGTISWNNKKHLTLALSTIEVEYMAATHDTKKPI